MQTDIVRARWWLAYPIALVLLAILDAFLALWHPLPERLPAQFSPAYLRLVLRDVVGTPPSTVVLGDSVLWGYKIDARQTAVASLQQSVPAAHLINLAYEGGSTANSNFLLDNVLASGIHVRGVIVNVNVKEFNANDSAYQTLHPSLERDVLPALTPDDRRLLTLHEPSDLNARLNGFVERAWRLYRLRVDIRQHLFGKDDLTSAVGAFLNRLTGEAATAAALHRPTPDKFLGTYDLSPITPTNVAFVYYKKMLSTLCARRIPALVFLTPANHALLHDYIDNSDYEANLATLLHVPHCASIRFLNLDRAIPANEFIDNDHLTPAGQQRLAALLKPYVEEFAR